jgi:hypothetical protein
VNSTQRNLLPDYGKEALAGSRDRPREQAALLLPGGLWRCQLAAAERSLPRRRTLRKNLLQHGADVFQGHPADLHGAGQLHCRWRLRARHGRREHHRQGQRHHLPRRTSSYNSNQPLVKAATGEVVSSEELGGGAVHTRISGVSDHLA